ncbi:MAG: hypothetical protein ACREJC_11720 [Tepidisphaeraceae bacterium]
MAKGRRTAALFEVIHSGRFDRPLGALGTPKWWFKRRPRDVDSLTSAPAEGDRAGDLTTPRSGDDPTVGRQPSGINVALDHDRHQVTVRASYTSALVTVFAAVILVALAFIVGRRMSRGPALAVASQTSEELQAGPAHPGALNLAPPTRPQRTAEETATPPAVVFPVHESPFADGARVIGHNYVVIQSYPDEKSAVEARDLLVKGGIACTVEQKLRGLNPNWYTVVGTDAFPRGSDEAYQQYVAKLGKISTEYAGKKSFKAFQPLRYKWDKPAP